MKSNRLTCFAWFLGVFACILFCTQTILGQAEHLGLISCPEHHETASTEKSSASNIEHCVCCQPMVNDTENLVSAVSSKSLFVAITDDRITDGPVKAIEVPPQLS